VGLTKLLVEIKLCGLLPVGLTKLLVETKLCGLTYFVDIMWIFNNIDILCIWCNIKEKSPTVSLDGLVFHALHLSAFGV
jgi:hypothetical protein